MEFVKAQISNVHFIDSRAVNHVIFFAKFQITKCNNAFNGLPGLIRVNFSDMEPSYGRLYWLCYVAMCVYWPSVESATIAFVTSCKHDTEFR